MSSFLHRATSLIGIMIFGMTALAPSLALAQGQFGQGLPGNNGNIRDEQLGITYGAATGLPNTDVRVAAARIIRAAMGLLGIAALVIVLIGGYTWMMAGGNEEKVGEAKKWILAGVIGMAIMLAAYSIAGFVISNLVSATSGGYYNYQ